MNPTATKLIANGYAPTTLNAAGVPAANDWKDRQPDLNDESAPFGVLTSCPPPLSASSPVMNWRASWLTVVTVEGVPESALADLDAFITGGARVPVRTSGNIRQYLFKTAGLHVSEGKTVSIYNPASGFSQPLVVSVGSQGKFVPLVGDWANSPLDMRAAEIPALDASAAKALVDNLSSFATAHEAPRTELPEWKPTPILQPGEKLVFNNLRARNALRQAGYLICPVAQEGSVPPKFENSYAQTVGIPWNSDYPGHDVGLAVPGFAALEISWGVTAAVAEAWEKCGAAPRGAEVAAGIERILMSHVAGGDGQIAARRNGDSVTFLFRASGFAKQFDAKRSPLRADGMEVSNSSVRITCRTDGAPVVISDEGWSVDFLATKRAELASLTEGSFKDALADIEAWLKAGADLDQPQAANSEAETQAPRPRVRKAAGM